MYAKGISHLSSLCNDSTRLVNMCLGLQVALFCIYLLLIIVWRVYLYSSSEFDKHTLQIFIHR